MRRIRRVALITLGLSGALALAYVGFVRWARLEPPPMPVAARASGPSTGRLERRGTIWELTLRGDAATLGSRHAELARDLMHAIDFDLDRSFRARIPNPAARWLIFNLVRARAHALPRFIPAERQRELAAEAQTYARSDPLASTLPTYHRLLIYHALYDFALGFEKSPLLGCSVFGVSGPSSQSGHLLIGRNFDLEQDRFDRDKVVLRVLEDGQIPYLSVAWAGMTGVVTGLSQAGIFVAVNGGRAGAPRSEGVPLPFILRAILQQARSIDQAIEIAERMPVMVSHILFLGDGSTGEMAVLERSPTEVTVRRQRPGTFYVTNHFLDAPLRDDPRNQDIQRSSTTLARYMRLRELLPPSARPLDVAHAVAVLRDRNAAGGLALARGDRRAIDAGIATHSVVADATARVLYVAEGPHTEGRYLAFTVLP
ncbi:MAG TPA: C45 family peptidase [Polyangia bacterium]|nr:C45 family peptidase [Polyangia bacterium]